MTCVSFVRYGPAEPASPVVLSAPHAGRDYPLALRAALRVPLGAIQSLEDRFVDLLALGARRNETLFVAQKARAWIDLNRAEDDRDPRLDDGAYASGRPLSLKVRSGLGLVPRRVNNAGEIWQHRFSAEDIAARIAADHRPYHAAIAQALTAAKARFGIAILLDIHSMPPLNKPPVSPQLVLGDRLGKSAGRQFLSRIENVARAYCVPAAANAPYAGGHILDRHANPRDNIHAIQLEFDRSLYLDSRHDQPGPGMDDTLRLLRAIIDAVTAEALPGAIAAE